MPSSYKNDLLCDKNDFIHYLNYNYSFVGYNYLVKIVFLLLITI